MTSILIVFLTLVALATEFYIYYFIYRNSVEKSFSSLSTLHSLTNKVSPVPTVQISSQIWQSALSTSCLPKGRTMPRSLRELLLKLISSLYINI